jgi:hypothetical protein
MLASYTWRACAADPLSSWPALGLRGCHLPPMRGVEVQLYENLPAAEEVLMSYGLIFLRFAVYDLETKG